MTWPFDALLRAWLKAEAEPEPVLHVDHAGWLHGRGVERWPSPRGYPELGSDGPVGIVWHATSVRPGVPLWKRIQKYRPGKDRAASWHLLVETDGRVYQSRSCLQGAWHCHDTPEWHRAQRADPAHYIHWSPNRCLLGIELAATEACEHPGYGWPAAQVMAARALLRLLAEHYQMLAPLTVLEHRQLDPTRRGDPGPTWIPTLKGGELEMPLP